jgi:hypothetical protein
MVIIRFPDEPAEVRALGFLSGRFSFTTWASGETLVPEAALAALARAGIRFSVEGTPTYEQRLAALRAAPAAAIQ